MKILAEETVVRYHVEFDGDETRILKRLGFLPPYAAPPARLWSTQAELDDMTKLFTNVKGPVP